MTTRPPDRLITSTNAARPRTVLKTLAPGSNLGDTNRARPRPRPAPANQRRIGTSTGSIDRLTIQWYTDDIVTDQGRIASWGGYGSAFDQEGDSIQLSDPTTDDGRIYLFGEGLYCVTITLSLQHSVTTSSDQVVAASAQMFDRPDGESIACAVRGGDPITNDTGVHGVSSTFYSEGQGFGSSRANEFYVRCNGSVVSADVGRATLTAMVQKIVSFG